MLDVTLLAVPAVQKASLVGCQPREGRLFDFPQHPTRQMPQAAVICPKTLRWPSSRMRPARGQQNGINFEDGYRVKRGVAVLGRS